MFRKAGVPPAEFARLDPRGLSAADAQRLINTLANQRMLATQFGPRFLALRVLKDAAGAGGGSAYAQLQLFANAHTGLVAYSPAGYLVRWIRASRFQDPRHLRRLRHIEKSGPAPTRSESFTSTTRG